MKNAGSNPAPVTTTVRDGAVVAHKAHNLEVGGSIPSLATNCGCSTKAVQKTSNLLMWVRFPSSAPTWQGIFPCGFVPHSRPRKRSEGLRASSKTRGVGCPYIPPMKNGLFLGGWRNGRRSSFRDCTPKGGAGSSPVPPTIHSGEWRNGRRGSFRNYCFGVRVRVPPCPQTKHTIVMSANLNEILKDKLSSMSDTEIDRVMDEVQKVSKDIGSPSADAYTRFLEQMNKYAETQFSEQMEKYAETQS